MKTDPRMHEQVAGIVESLYDLGTVTDVREIFGGFTNRSFGVRVVKNGETADYFVRRYKSGIDVGEIRFEHRLIEHAIRNGLHQVAAVVKNRGGDTVVRPAGGERFFAVYEFLAGEDRYSWDRPDLSDAEFESAGHLLAAFHNAARNFDPGGFRRREPPILELWPRLPGMLRQLARWPDDREVFRYFRRHIDVILQALDRTVLTPAGASDVPVIPIHCDYHPGNLKWEGDTATGLFDFDWAKMDLRLFDVGMALVYFCSRWNDERDGEMRLDKMALFLGSYQRCLLEHPGLKPIGEGECALLPTLLAVANSYLLQWCLSQFAAATAPDEGEYLRYLRHSVRLMDWVDGHCRLVAETVTAAIDTKTSGT